MLSILSIVILPGESLRRGGFPLLSPVFTLNKVRIRSTLDYGSHLWREVSDHFIATLDECDSEVSNKNNRRYSQLVSSLVEPATSVSFIIETTMVFDLTT